MVTRTNAAVAQKGSSDRSASSTRSQNQHLQASALEPSRASYIQGQREGGLGGTSASHPVLPLAEPLLLDSREVARLLGVGRTKAFELMAGALPVVRIGRSVRVSRSALELWIAAESTHPRVDRQFDRDRRPSRDWGARHS